MRPLLKVLLLRTRPPTGGRVNYTLARRCLEKAVELSGGPDKRDLKKLALLGQAQRQWADMPLSPKKLADLGAYLEKQLSGGIGERNRHLTEQWLQQQNIDKPQKILEALEKRGAYSDFQVLYNVVRG